MASGLVPKTSAIFFFIKGTIAEANDWSTIGQKKRNP